MIDLNSLIPDPQMASSWTIIHVIDNQARLSPNAVAIETGQSEVSYRELVSKSRQVAAYLSDHGVKAGSRIGLSIEPSPELWFALLGILRSGATYVPLDPAYPKDRVQQITKLANLDAILVSDNATHLFDSAASPLIPIRKFSRSTADREVVVTCNETMLAYIIFTSGSTGIPKGVAIKHSALTNLLLSMGQILEVQRNDTIVSVASTSFDMSVPELYLPCLTSAPTGQI